MPRRAADDATHSNSQIDLRTVDRLPGIFGSILGCAPMLAKEAGHAAEADVVPLRQLPTRCARLEGRDDFLHLASSQPIHEPSLPEAYGNGTHAAGSFWTGVRLLELATHLAKVIPEVGAVQVGAEKVDHQTAWSGASSGVQDQAVQRLWAGLRVQLRALSPRRGKTRFITVAPSSMTGRSCLR